MYKNLVVALTMVAGLGWPATALAQVNINVNVRPPVVLVSPPKLVIVPNSPVKYAPEVNANLFFHDGRYYSLHEDRWLVAGSHSGPWAVIEVGRVPPPVIAVPSSTTRSPPGTRRRCRGVTRGARTVPPARPRKAAARSPSPPGSPAGSVASVPGGLLRHIARSHGARAIFLRHAAAGVREGPAHRLHVGPEDRLPIRPRPLVRVAHREQRALEVRHHVAGEELVASHGQLAGGPFVRPDQHAAEAAPAIPL